MKKGATFFKLILKIICFSLKQPIYRICFIYFFGGLQQNRSLKSCYNNPAIQFESLKATQQSRHRGAGHHSDTQMSQTLVLRCNYLIKGLGQQTEPTCTPTAGMIQRPEDPQLFITNEKPPEPCRETLLITQQTLLRSMIVYFELELWQNSLRA